MQPRTRVNVTHAGDVIIAQLTDRKILDEPNITQIGEQLRGLIAEEPRPRLVLDFDLVSHMSSSTLGMLITLNKRVREREGQLRLCNIHPALREIFAITRLDEILDIHDSRNSAVTSLE